MNIFSNLIDRVRSMFGAQFFTLLDEALHASPVIRDLFFSGKPQDGFLPDYPESEREILWVLRNPFQGLTRKAALQEPFLTVGLTVDAEHLHGQTWLPDGETGINWLLHYDSKGNRYPFVSYRGEGFEAYSGWRPSGVPGVALRKAKATGV